MPYDQARRKTCNSLPVRIDRALAEQRDRADDRHSGLTLNVWQGKRYGQPILACSLNSAIRVPAGAVYPQAPLREVFR